MIKCEALVSFNVPLWPWNDHKQRRGGVLTQTQEGQRFAQECSTLVVPVS